MKKISYHEDKSQSTKDDVVAGYDVEELIKAPLKEPTPKKIEPKKEIYNPNVKFLVISGALLSIVGFVLLIATFDLLIGFIVMGIGAILTLIGVFKNFSKK